MRVIALKCSYSEDSLMPAAAAMSRMRSGASEAAAIWATARLTWPKMAIYGRQLSHRGPVWAR